MPYALTQELYSQVRAFLRSLAGECASCLRRNMGHCDNCYARMASVLGERMDFNSPPQTNALDYSQANRIKIVLAQLRKAGRPLRADEIDLRDYCTKELKHRTLNKMISLGKIRREKRGFFYVFILAGQKRKENENGCNKEKRDGAGGTSGGIAPD